VRARPNLLLNVTFALLVGSHAASLRAQSEPLEDLASFPRTTLEIVSGTAHHRIDAWVADSDARKRQGLMYVRELAASQGMLFTQCCSGIWMRNTYIELDIVFVHEGRITKIAARAKPFDEHTIGADGPVDAVIELRGGEAEVLKLKPGDRVSWREPH
jgi:uncharacterized membrane protein (UPF0127 family)